MTSTPNPTRREQAATARGKFFTDLMLLAAGYLPLMAAISLCVQALLDWSWLPSIAVGVVAGIPGGGILTHKLQQRVEAARR